MWLAMSPGDRTAWLRSLQTAIRIIVGPAGEPVAEALKRAEEDQQGAALISAAAMLESVPSLQLRRVVSVAAACLPRKIPASAT